jgi:hypothetical protein
MRDHLAYAAAIAHVDDLRREAVAEQLSAAGRERHRRVHLFSRFRKRPTRPRPTYGSLSASGLRAVARRQ